MKKTLIALTLFFSMYFANAQTQFGIHADGILASQTAEASGLKISSDSRFSWKVGVIANAPINEQFSFMPQLNLLSKGSKFNFQDVKSETQLTYIELPLNFVYNSNGFFGGLGPVLSYGVGGKEKVTDGTDSYTQKVKFDGNADGSDDYSHYKAFEFGGNIVAGYKLESGLFFKANYNFGLSNISPDPDATGKNKYFGFGIGYFFSGSE